MNDEQSDVTSSEFAFGDVSVDSPAGQRGPAAGVKSSSRGGSRAFSLVAGYALAVTALLVGLVATGRVTLFRNHRLESLPDLRPLDSNEFQKVPDGTSLPDGHVLRIGESRRFGDVLVTPVQLTWEPVEYVNFISGDTKVGMTTSPLLKLWLKFENVSDSYAFPPLDVHLISHRSPPEGDDSQTLANSWLNLTTGGESGEAVRFLNLLHSPNSNFLLRNQNSGRVIRPGETVTTYVPCSTGLRQDHFTDSTRGQWRIQIRKGVHLDSGHGVTTLIDVNFSSEDFSTMPLPGPSI